MYQFDSQTTYQFAGLVGVIFYIFSYLLLQLGVIRGGGYTYPTLNLIASSMVLISLWQSFNLSSAIIQTTWVAISIFGIVRHYLMTTGLRFNDEERGMMEDVLADMPHQHAHKFLRAGSWFDAQPGMVLTTEGKPVTDLYYIARGDATVFSGKKPIAEIRRGFVGEIGVMESDLATASVEIKTPTRLFSMNGDKLRKICRNDHEFRWSLERHLADATKQKLVEANHRLSSGNKDAAIESG